MQTLIKFSGWLNFPFWFFKGQTLKKTVELNVKKKGFVGFKTDKYEGVAKELNTSLALLFRYCAALGFALLLMPEIFHDRVLFLFTMLVSINIGFHAVLLNNAFNFKVLGSMLGFCALFFVMYWFINAPKLSTMGILAFRPSAFFFFVFAIIDDFMKIRKAKFYNLKDVRILFYVENRK